MSKREAHDYAWQSAIAAFPPPGQSPVELPAVEPLEPPAQNAQEHASVAPAASTTTGNLKGLGDIPEAWGALPSNSSLPTEIAWVQANRLLVVEERPSGATVVHLDRALSSAPSHAALGWLETSIRSYAKYVDVVARSLQTVQDEQDQVRRERLQIAEIDELLGEMV